MKRAARLFCSFDVYIERTAVYETVLAGQALFVANVAGATGSDYTPSQVPGITIRINERGERRGCVRSALSDSPLTVCPAPSSSRPTPRRYTAVATIHVP